MGDILRREGLYAADLTRIRDQVWEGARLGAIRCGTDNAAKKTNGGSWER